MLNGYFAGEGVKLHNCKFNWSAGSINGSNVGLFTNTNPNFPFSSGILLTTGNISYAIGPNDSGGSENTTNVDTASYDPDLAAIATDDLNSTSVLEFNFYSTNDLQYNSISFNYIFGSEEYREWVCSSYNDVFAFFLDGPYTRFNCERRNRNIALIPGTSLPVAINNVNHGSGGTSGIDCHFNYTQFYKDNTSNAIQYDGYTANNNGTIGLEAPANLCQCSEYHMKLTIANVGDNNFASGVFLEQGSFQLPKALYFTDSTNLDNDTIIKNCNYSYIDLHYTGTIDNPFNIIMLSDGGTAAQGDFNLFFYRENDAVQAIHHGDTIIFHETDTLLRFRLECAEDAHFNPGEVKTVQLVFKSVLCPEFRYLDGTIEERAQNDTLNFVMIDNNRFELVSDSIFYCDRCTHVETPITGGTEPLIYRWTPANLLNTPNARESDCNVTESTTFEIIVSDRWGCLVDTCTHKALITSTPVLEGHYHITPNVICVPETVEFSSTATPASTHQWVIYTDNTSDTIYGNPQTYTFTNPGRYSILYHAYEALECDASINLVNYINAGMQPTALFTFDPAEAEVGQNVIFTNESEGLNVHYQWSFGDGSNSTEENPTHVYNSENSDNYNVILTVSDEANCQDIYIQPVPVVDNHVLFVPNSFTPNKDGLNDIFKPVVACVARYYIMIYDRTGSLVFTTDNPEIGWDGKTLEGIECPSGVYTYYINYVRFNNLKQELIKTGSIYLIR